MSKGYSYLKGIVKGLKAMGIMALSFVIALIASKYPELNASSVLDMVYDYLKPIAGGLTVGGLMTFTLNYLKNR